MKRGDVHPMRLAVFVVILGVSLFFWESAVLAPFKLLSVMGHETGHAVAAKLVGGAVNRVTVRPNESGECLSAIPPSFMAKVAVYSAGYVGSAIIAVVLLALTFRFNARRGVLRAAAVWLAVMAFLFGRDLFTLGFCLGMSALFVAAARWLPEELVAPLNLFLASFTALYAVMDVRDDLWSHQVRSLSDAQLLADVTQIPAVVWALCWTLVSAAIVFAGALFALRGPKGSGLLRTRSQTSMSAQ
jgi:hypothetical protein